MKAVVYKRTDGCILVTEKAKKLQDETPLKLKACSINKLPWITKRWKNFKNVKIAYIIMTRGVPWT